MSNNLKIETNRKMIGKEVFVNSDGGWRGVVIEVLNQEEFWIFRNGNYERVSIFDIRSIE